MCLKSNKLFDFQNVTNEILTPAMAEFHTAGRWVGGDIPPSNLSFPPRFQTNLFQHAITSQLKA